MASGLLVFYVVPLVLFFVFSDSLYVNALTVLAAVATAAILAAGIQAASPRFRVIHVMLAFYAGCKYLLFPIAILRAEASPSFASYLATYESLTAGRVLTMQVFGLLAVIAGVGGFLAAEAIPSTVEGHDGRSLRSLHRDRRHTHAFTLVALAIVGYGTYIFSKVGWGSLSGIETQSGDNLWGLANGQAPLYLSLAAIAYGSRRRLPGDLRPYVLIVILLIVQGLLQGSRSAFFMTALDFGLIYLLVNGDPPVRVSVVRRACTVGLVVGAIVFTVATSAKGFYLSGFEGSLSGLLTQASSGLTTQTVDNFGPVEVPWRMPGAEVFEKFLKRLADSKAPYYIINDLALNPPGEYMGVADTTRRTLNAVIPGTPFREAVRPTQLFEWVYFGELPVYSGETWGLPTVCYLYFGYVAGLIVFGLIAFCFALAYRVLLSRVTTYAPIATVLIVVGFNNVIQSGVVELWLPAVFQFVVSIIVFVGLWRLLSTIATVMRGVPASPQPNTHGLA